MKMLLSMALVAVAAVSLTRLLGGKQDCRPLLTLAKQSLAESSNIEAPAVRQRYIGVCTENLGEWQMSCLARRWRPRLQLFQFRATDINAGAILKDLSTAKSFGHCFGLARGNGIGRLVHFLAIAG